MPTAPITFSILAPQRQGMITVSTSRAQSSFDEALNLVLPEPVAVTSRGKAVPMSFPRMTCRRRLTCASDVNKPQNGMPPILL